MWWHRVPIVLAAIGFTAAGALADAGTGTGSEETETAVSVPVAPEPGELSQRDAEVKAREARLRLWEADLTRRARGERYFQDLEGYITPGELTRAVLVSVLLSLGIVLLAMKYLDRIGVGTRKPSRSKQELERLEARVLSGLQEFDELLTRLYDRLEKDAIAPIGREGASETADAGSDTPESTESRRQQAVAMIRGGADREEIGRRLHLGSAEVDFIMKMEASR